MTSKVRLNKVKWKPHIYFEPCEGGKGCWVYLPATLSQTNSTRAKRRLENWNGLAWKYVYKKYKGRKYLRV